MPSRHQPRSGNLRPPHPARRGAGAKDAIDQRKSTYSRYEGVDLLRKAIAMKLERDNGLKVDPRPRSSPRWERPARSRRPASRFRRGRRGDLFEPYYGYHLNTLLVAEVKPKFVSMSPPDWKVDLAKLEAAIHSEDARHHDLHALEPVRQGVDARGDRRGREDRREARSADHHGRDLRVHRLRRPASTYRPRRSAISRAAPS